MIKKCSFLAILFITQMSYPVVTAVGDEKTDNVTFDFAIGKTIYNAERASFWTVAGEDISAKDANVQDFGIAETPMVSGDGAVNPTLKAYPHVTENAQIVTYDSGAKKASISDSAANPLRGKKLTQLSMVSNKPVFVQDGYVEAQDIYALQDIVFTESGAETNSSIFAKHSLTADNQVVNLAGLGSNLVYASAKKTGAAATFGVDTSNIGFVSLKATAIDEKNRYYFYPESSLAVSKATDVLKAGTGDLTALHDVISMHPYSSNTMLLGFGVEPGGAGGDCAVGVVRATLTNEVIDAEGKKAPASAIELSSILPDAVAQGGVNTALSAINGYSALIRNLTTTITSTGLQYLIVSYDNTANPEAVYAVPLVTRAANATDNGKIAKFNSVDVHHAITGNVYRQQGFSQVIDDATEIQIGVGSPPDTSKRVVVGGGYPPLTAGQTMGQLFTQGDSVYVVTNQAYGGDSRPGIFRSQALFDAQGRVVAWTRWVRVEGTNERIPFAMQNKSDRRCMYVTEHTPGGGTFNTIRQNTWNNSNPTYSVFATEVSQQMPASQGGVQGLMSESRYTPGLITTGVSLVLATGLDRVVIGQTGHIDTFFKIKTIDAADVVTLTDVEGLDIGAIVTTAFGDDGADNHWLFMGGSKGLSVLTDAAGLGWNGDLGAVADLTNAGQACKSLGDFSFVKKIAHDDVYLYVMTLDALYRIALDVDKFKDAAPDPLDVVEVVKAQNLNIHASLLDVIIDNELIILATTAGMYTIDDSARPGGDPVITEVEIPGGLPAVGKLSSVSTEYDIFKKFKDLSNLYVLTFDFGTEQARLNRFNITAGVVTPIQDRLFEGQDYSLLVFNNFKNDLFIDGGLGFATSYKIGETSAVLKNILPGLQAGRSSTQNLIKNYTYDIALSVVSSTNSLVGIGQDFASGATMIAGDFGILMNA